MSPQANLHSTVHSIRYLSLTVCSSYSTSSLRPNGRQVPDLNHTILTHSQQLLPLLVQINRHHTVLCVVE